MDDISVHSRNSFLLILHGEASVVLNDLYSHSLNRTDVRDNPVGSRRSRNRVTNLIAVDVSGDRIDQVAVFSNKSGKWRTQDLRSPVKGRVFPLMNATIALYRIGRHIYAYSAPADSWDTLELPEGKTARAYLNPLSIVVQDGDSIHVFSAKTGKWQGVNVGNSR